VIALPRRVHPDRVPSARWISMSESFVAIAGLGERVSLKHTPAG
jgi:hypothetical protein